jgi:cysteine desulfurase family protein (TIGR01976 family)
MNNQWDVDAVRARFPALAITDDGVPRAYLDAPAGTQVADRVLERMHGAMVEACANARGAFRTSQAADALLAESHAVMAEFLGASGPDEIVFGLNATSLLFRFSRMLARDWRQGDEIVLSRMDHDANVAPWLVAAEERGVTVKWLEFDRESFRYRYQDLGELIGPRTRLVACAHVSNLLGTINDVAAICAAGRSVGAVTVVDGVQSAPHMLVDVQALGCDLFACSAYKFFGPHAAALYVRREILAGLTPVKVRPSSNDMPWRFAPGTPSFEAQSGTVGAIEHIAWLGEAFGGAAPGAPLRERLRQGWAASVAHELQLTRLFLDGLSTIPGANSTASAAATSCTTACPPSASPCPAAPRAKSWRTWRSRTSSAGPAASTPRRRRTCWASTRTASCGWGWRTTARGRTWSGRWRRWRRSRGPSASAGCHAGGLNRALLSSASKYVASSR